MTRGDEGKRLLAEIRQLRREMLATERQFKLLVGELRRDLNNLRAELTHGGE